MRLTNSVNVLLQWRKSVGVGSLKDYVTLTYDDQAGTVHTRSVDQLKGDLETEQNNLEMNRGANPGVVAQYERRKEEVKMPHL
jgi:hypothetical protein